MFSPIFAQSAAENKDPAREDSKKPTASKTEANGLTESKPTIYYLKNKNGTLVAVPDFQLDDYLRLYKLDKNLAAPEPPSHAMNRLTITGEAKEKQASLNLEFEILTEHEGWLRVPLRFNNAHLQEHIVPAGSKDQIIEYANDQDGYVCWIRCKKEQRQYLIKLKMLAPLQQVGGATRFVFQAPRATSSELKLVIPSKQATATINDGDSLLSSKPSPGGKTELSVLGLRGEMRLAWREGLAEPTTSPPVLIANGALVIRAEGIHRLTVEANLEVNSFGGPMDSFQIRLPPSFQLVPTSPQQRYQLTILEEENKESNQLLGTLLEIKLNRKTTEPVSIRLRAEFNRNPNAKKSLIETAGFEVVGAVRQWGFIDVIVDGDWATRWEADENVERLSELPLPLKENGGAARFEYFKQPYSLKLEVLPKEKRVRVEPSYEFLVDPHQVRLDAHLNYLMSGAKADQLSIDLEGWTIDHIGPDNLILLDDLDLDQTTPLRIPLTSLALQSMGGFEIQIQAHRDIINQPLLFSLPTPTAKTRSPAVVTITQADNVELVPRQDAFKNLFLDAFSVQGSNSIRHQRSFHYRTRGDGKPAEFVAHLEVKERAITVASAGTVKIEERQIQVEQKLSYRVAYETVRKLTLDAPQSVVDSNNLIISLDEKAIPWTPHTEEFPFARDSRKLIDIDLLEDRIGPIELVVQFTVPLPTIQEETPLEFSAPLVSPYEERDITFLGTALDVTYSTVLQVQPGQGPWTTAVEETSTAQPLIRFSSHLRVDEAPLMIGLSPIVRQGSTIVHKAWIQTWLSSSTRRDRSVFQLTTRDKQIKIQLPSGILTENIEASLNGFKTEFQILPTTGEISIPLSRNEQNQENVLELWCWFEDALPSSGSLSLELPQISDASWSRHVFWQLITPSNEHLLFAPLELTSENQWKWRSSFWEQQASSQQIDLERWIGSTNQAQDSPPHSANQYLFSSFKAINHLKVRIVPRRTILLVVALPTLCFGLLLIYFPLLRHPGVLFLTGFVLIALSILSPALSLLAAQSASLGITVVLAASLLNWVVKRRHEIPASGGFLSSGDSKTITAAPKFDSGSHPSTPSRTLSIQVPSTEARP